MQLAVRLRSLLKSHDITASHLSRKTNIRVQTLSNWMSGQTPRDIRQVKRVAQYFNMTIDELVFGEESPLGSSKSILRNVFDNDIFEGEFEVILRRIKK